MLQEVVRENVDLLSTRASRKVRSRIRGPRRWLRRIALVVVPALLFISINAISVGRASKPDVVVFSPGQEISPLPADPNASRLALAPPRRVDPSLFRLGVTTVVIDPGHGGTDPGALTSLGLTEKEITLDVGRRLRALLVAARFKVEMTRDQDETISLKDRAQFANGHKADLFVSIHVNSVPGSDRRLVETYFLGPSDDPHVDALVGEENRGSGYTMTNFKKLLDGIYADVRQSESKTFALAVQKELFTSLRKGNPTLHDHGVKSAPFIVLIATEMPGILAEVSCISNEAEARNLSHPAYRQSIAQALYDGLHSYAEERTPLPSKGS